ncbi:MAG: Lrp/AsnC family transcriptional regulator [Acidobacteria bacterium]|nr:Lrp/AsnC family transcriptional regulator [Acidobacteriota bacterium]
MIDKIDRKILAIIQKNNKTSYAEIGKQVGMAASAIFDRMRKLEKKGVVIGHEARLDSRAVNISFKSYVYVELDNTSLVEDTAKKLAALDNVLEIHFISGSDALLLKVVAKDIKEFSDILAKKIAVVSNIKNTSSNIVLETIKETSVLPLSEN